MAVPLDYQAAPKEKFTRYQVFVIAIIAFIQFSVVLDFMVLSPLGAILMPKLNINPNQWGYLIACYPLAAFFSGIFTASIADKFDRKKLLLIFFTGFILGTLMCAISNSFYTLLFSRILTGLFGGVISSIGMAIITDLFSYNQRGRVVGFTQMAFGASQVLGLPISLYLSAKFDWHAPFFMIVIFASIVLVILGLRLKPINEHLKIKNDKNALMHLYHTLINKDYAIAFTASVLLATGGYMMMPFGTVFATKNLGLSTLDLPLIYLLTGISTVIIGPLFGKLSDKIGKYKMFVIGTTLSIAMVIIYTNLGITYLPMAIILNIILFIGIMGRIIPAQALSSSVPDAKDRGAFMSVNTAIQHLSGFISASIAGTIVSQKENGALENYNILGYVVAASMVVTLFLMYRLYKMVKLKYS